MTTPDQDPVISAMTGLEVGVTAMEKGGMAAFGHLLPHDARRVLRAAIQKAAEEADSEDDLEGAVLALLRAADMEAEDG